MLFRSNKNIEINDAIVAQAEADAPKSGYDTQSFYVLPLRDELIDNTADASDVINTADSETAALDASYILNGPKKDYYVGYLTGDGVPPNGAPYTFGSSFPTPSTIGQFHLRTDFFPNRLFRWNGRHWVKFEDNVRMTMTNKPVDGKPDAAANTRQTQKGTFINNNNTATIAGKVVPERQALSKALKPKADN